MKIPRSFILLSIVLWSLNSARADDLAVTGNLTVTGAVVTGGQIDSDSNKLSFGSGATAPVELIYVNADADTFTFSTLRNPASWLWVHSTAVAAMRLDSAHQLILYQADGLTPGLTFAPASNSIKLGTHANGTLTADANGVITTGGGFTVAGSFTNTNASATTSFMGNVGVGTASVNNPALFTRMLQVSAAGSAMFSVRDTAHAQQYDFGVNDSAGTGSYDFTIYDATAGLHRLVVKQSGNVGIGTTSPTALLQVGTIVGNQGFKVGIAGNMANSNAEIRNSLAVIGDSASSGSSIGATAWNFYNAGNSPSWSGALLQFFGTDYAGNVYGLPGANQGTLVFQNASNGVIATNGMTSIHIAPYGTPAATFTASGNVGIGTTNPAYRLQIQKTSTAAPALMIGGGFAGGPRIQTYGLDADGNAWMGLGTDMSGGPYEHNLYFPDTGGYGFQSIGSFNGTTYSEKMRVTRSGNVGIGTAVPSQKLEIAGGGLGFSGSGLSASDKKLFSPTDGDLEWVTHNFATGHGFAVSHQGTRLVYLNTSGNSYLNGGNVGIGTANPGTRLDVNGAASVSGLLLASGDALIGNGTNRLYLRNLSGTNRIDSYNYPISATVPLQFNAATVSFQIADSEKVVINSAGNVGIGTSTPSAGLTVSTEGGDYSAGSYFLVSSPNSSFGGGATLAGIKTTAADGGNYNFLKIQNAAGTKFVINGAGNVGIGTVSPTAKLAVNGTIRAKEVIVDTGWADYVFAEDYRLAPLSEVESHIKAQKHLPGIPSAAEVAEHGVSMGDMQARLLSKVEELTLHLIAQEKRMREQSEQQIEQQQEIAALKARNVNFQQQIAELKSTSTP